MSMSDLEARIGGGTAHFMGVGGAGMCALAELLHRAGHDVTGCDVNPGASARALETRGVPLLAGHDPDHLHGVTLLVVSAAIPPEHAEIQAARERGIPVIKRAEALGQWVNRGTVVGIAGTHGKTTTTALATEILVAAGLDPTGVVGGHVAGWAGNLRYGEGELFVVEADEYDRSFHALDPDVAVVTNLEADHLDIYGSLDGVREAFRSFVDSVPAEGSVCACADDSGASRLLPGLTARAYTYGFSAGAQLRGIDVRANGASTRLRVFESGEDRGELSIPLAGAHNALNALGAASAARRLGVEWHHIRKGLAAFSGVHRRFQLLGTARGITVVDDYAHHPTEIAAALATARSGYPGARVVAVFQPHLYSRTRDFADGFGAALSTADSVWVTDIYPAREEPIPGISGELVVRAASAEGRGSARYHTDLESLPSTLASALKAGDVCLTLGAGSVETIGPALLRELEGGGDA